MYFKFYTPFNMTTLGTPENVRVLYGFPSEHEVAESLMDACINKGAAQHQLAERMSDTF